MKTKQATNKSQPVIVSLLWKNIVLGPISSATKMFAATLRIAEMLRETFPEPFPTGDTEPSPGRPVGPLAQLCHSPAGWPGQQGRVPPAVRTRAAQPGPRRESPAARRTGSTRGVGVCTQFLKRPERLAESESRRASPLPPPGTPPAPAFLEDARGHVLGCTHHCSMHAGCGWHLPMAYPRHWHLPSPWMPTLEDPLPWVTDAS